MKKSEFEIWFEEMYGKRPSRKPNEAIVSDLYKKERISNMARRLYKDCELWDEKEKSASYAWNARAKLDGPK